MATLLAERRLVAEGFLLAFNAFVYYDALWGAPRADQLIYLYEASRFQSAAEVFAHSPSWNRTVSVGDHALYRPFLYLFLALQRGVFGMNVFLWQGVSLTLHAIQCVLLYRLFRYCSPRTAVANLLLAALFGSAFISSEAVIWHHINAYLLFTVCVTASLHRLLLYLDLGRSVDARLAILLALGATFTYEAGILYCALAAAAVVVSACRSRAGPPQSPCAAPSPAGSRARLALAFCGVIALYVTVDVVDFVARFGRVENSDVRPPALASLSDGLYFAAYNVLFWLGGAIVPSLYDLVPWYRTIFRGFKWLPAFESSINLLAVGAALLGGAGLLLSSRAHDVRRYLPGLVLPAVFLVAYASLISFGRTVPRGLDYTRRANLHYSYIAILTALVSIALAAWLARPATGSSGPVEGRRRGAPVWAALSVAGLCVLVAINAAATMHLVSAHRHFFSAPKLELLHHARQWHEAHRGAFFVVSEDCPGNEVLTDAMPWFRVYPRHVASTFRYLDALYPETSLNLNGGRAAGAPVVELSCAGGSISLEDVLGSWQSGRGRGRITKTAVGGLLLSTEEGDESVLVIRGHRMLAVRWNAPGVLSADHRYIFWKSGAVWRR